ncbi:MAG: S8 family serine peptidase [Micromonosporaceae bacterium]|nr:S8 family serine peptidase [Micromonosporaceae bacterium]
MRVRQLLATGLSVGVLVTAGGVLVANATAQPGTASGPPSSTVSAGPGVGGLPQTVVLITGDRVQVNPDGSVVTRPAPGREHITFTTSRSNDRVTVVPSDAVPLLAAGRLDERLFDVTTLLANGVAERGELPLIVQYSRGARERARSTVTERGARVERELPAIRGYALRENRSNVGELWRGLTDQAGATASARGGVGLDGIDLGGVEKVWLDGRHKVALAESVPLINAPAAWAAGLDGTGVRVAVLDTGIDLTHPDLTGKVVARVNLTQGYEDDLDRSGHGTHVASILAGSGAASGGQYRGVAPGVELLDVKVCVLDGCAESWLIAGMHWAVENGAQIVNVSVGGLDRPGLDPVEQAVNELSATHGALFVISAGNAGPRPGTITSPGVAAAALTVGSLESVGVVDLYSSRGPATDGTLKPDILAPGVDITAARSKDGMNGAPGEQYVTESGTSAAAPHVAGAAAILKQKNPQWTGEQIKAALMASAVPFATAGVFDQGAGLVDVQRALSQTVVADPPSVSFGRAAWPHDDDPPVTTVITYRNVGASDVVVSLDVVTVGPDGQPAPAGMFTVDASQVTVPAGGTATVRLTASPREGAVDGLFGGWLVAAGGGAEVRTPFGLDREIEQHDVTIRFTGRSGAPAESAYAHLFAPGADDFYEFYGDGEATVRVPAGQYVFFSQILGETRVLLAAPQVTVDHDLTIDADARLAQPISVTLPDHRVQPVFAAAAVSFTTPEGGHGFAVSGKDWSKIYTGRIGPDVTVPGFASILAGTWARTDADGTPHNSPLVYQLAWASEGGMESGLTRSVTARQLARVTTGYARQAENVIGEAYSYPATASVAAFATAVPLDLPGERTVYYNSEPGVRWSNQFVEAVPNGTPWPDPVSFASAPATTYEAGRTYTESWNQAVFGPKVGGDAGEPRSSAIRNGNTLELSVPFADGGGRTASTRIDVGHLRLFRDGTLVGENDYIGGLFTVPPEPAQYRVEIEMERGEPHVLSTRVQAAWTFTSASTEQAVALPMLSVQVRPPLDETNAARHDQTLAIPVTVTGQPGSEAHATQVRVEVSYDDGATWRPTTVRRTGPGWTATVKHPHQAGFVSLRVTATGPHGTSVEQTVIRAYRIR